MLQHCSFACDVEVVVLLARKRSGGKVFRRGTGTYCPCLLIFVAGKKEMIWGYNCFRMGELSTALRMAALKWPISARSPGFSSDNCQSSSLSFAVSCTLFKSRGADAKAIGHMQRFNPAQLRKIGSFAPTSLVADLSMSLNPGTNDCIM